MSVEHPSKPAEASLLGAAMTALEFYTRVPRPDWSTFSADDARHAGAFAPLAGMLVAVIGAVTWWLAGLLLPEPLPVMIAIAVMVAVTGALHEDGLADVCDAFGARGTAQQTLDILKDPRLGVYGVLGLLLMIAARIAALWQISLLSDAMFSVMAATLVAAHALSRFAAVLLTRYLDYVRRDDARSRVSAFAAPLGGHWLQAAIAITVIAWVPLLMLGFFAAMWVLPLMLVCVAWLRLLFVRRIGGYTGDCLGCVQQVSEQLVYLSVLAVLFLAGGS
ncbi:MAG: adenosylcobinamide-GDP ribazoletransferase [Gammaproteobacteria bacterium]|jgi:adenosylcobinamide-GDP ribazoletransferase